MEAKAIDVDVEDWMIETESLTKLFGHVMALRGIDLTVRRGEFLTIFGPNGAGKTTLIRILSTLLKPTSGTVRISGIDARDDTENLRRNIGVISHNTFLYDNLSAYENIEFYGKMYDIENIEEKGKQVIKEVGLSGRMNDLVRTFSRGMQQRLSIARAIIHDPKVMLFDEPYTGLDQHAAQMLKNMLKKLHTPDRTVIMTTHNLQQGLEMCDRVAIQVAGQIVYQEDIAKVDLDNFEETYFHYVGKEYRWDS